MAVNNTLVKKQTTDTAITFTAGNDTVKLSPSIILKTLLTGNC